MMRLKLSIVYYLNSLPLAWGFLHGDQRSLFDLDFSPPSRCADLLAAGSVDIGLIPSIEYQRIQGVRVIPGLSIAAKQEVESVLLISKVPAEEIRTLALDQSSRTSIILLRLLLALKFKSQPVFYGSPPDPDAMLASFDAALIIGDTALKAGWNFPYQYDLAQEWKELTGKPFVFAFWGVRSGIVAADPKVFQQSLEYGLTHLDEIARQQAQALKLPEDRLRHYLTKNINYTLDQENIEGLQLFYQLTAETLGISCSRPLEFLAQAAI
ncbi:MAG: menaquinone biosynthesis protein [Terriglobia bacterium]